jgi:hypothetical protein
LGHCRIWFRFYGGVSPFIFLIHARDVLIRKSLSVQYHLGGICFLIGCTRRCQACVRLAHLFCRNVNGVCMELYYIHLYQPNFYCIKIRSFSTCFRHCRCVWQVADTLTLTQQTFLHCLDSVASLARHGTRFNCRGPECLRSASCMLT